MLEAKRGWANTISTKQDWREITGALGQRWEAALNTYKPFACGIVLHPAIDGAIQLRDEHHLAPDQIDRVELRVNPLIASGGSSPASVTGDYLSVPKTCRDVRPGLGARADTRLTV